MRLSATSIVPLTLVMLVIACNTVSPGDCWRNTSGGLGGDDTIPIGAAVGAGSGDFASPPSGGPLDYGGVANPCVEPQSPCHENCESSYSAAAAACGKIQVEAQRKACQDAAYAAYKSCRESCPKSGDDCLELCLSQCDKANEKCIKSCPKGSKSCMQACNEEYGRCIKECTKRCK